LKKLSDDKCEINVTRTEAEILLGNLLSFNFIALLHFWQYFLRKIERVEKRLQDPNMNFKNAALDIESLENILKNNREDLCSDVIKNAKIRCA
jgi:hypothetical protein